MSGCWVNSSRDFSTARTTEFECTLVLARNLADFIGAKSQADGLGIGPAGALLINRRPALSATSREPEETSARNDVQSALGLGQRTHA